MGRPKLNRTKVTYTLPREVHEALRDHAASIEKTASDVLEEMLRAKLKVPVISKRKPK